MDDRVDTTIRPGVEATVIGWLALSCRDLRGPFGFRVLDPVVIPCTTDAGAPLAIGWVRSRTLSDRCYDWLDQEVPDAPKDPPSACATFDDEVRDPQYDLCTTDPFILGRSRQQLLWVWELDQDGELQGAVAERADHTTCGGEDEDEDGPNTHAELIGQIEVVEDRGDAAVVSFDLDGVWGTVEFQVCR